MKSFLAVYERALVFIFAGLIIGLVYVASVKAEAALHSGLVAQGAMEQ